MASDQSEVGQLDLIEYIGGVRPMTAARMIPNDPVNPRHYDKYAIQPYDFITKNKLGFAEGNVIKYVCRWRDKNGVEDLKKARAYIDKLIAGATQQ